MCPRLQVRLLMTIHLGGWLLKSSFKRLRLERPKQAWESHPVFRRASPWTAINAARFSGPSVGVRETLNQPVPEENYGGEDASTIPWTLERRLRGFGYRSAKRMSAITH